MADPTFGALGTQSFGALSLTSSGDSSSLNLATSTVDELALASLGDLAESVYDSDSSSGEDQPTVSALFKPVWITSEQLGSFNVVAGQLIVVTDTGDLYVDTPIARIHLTNTALLAKNHGSDNAGKYLTVGPDGNIILTTLPIFAGEVV